MTLPTTIPAIAPVGRVEDLADRYPFSMASTVLEDDGAVVIMSGTTVDLALVEYVLILSIRLSIDVLMSGGSDWPGVKT
jgi:hypothetical protein